MQNINGIHVHITTTFCYICKGDITNRRKRKEEVVYRNWTFPRL